ncbi:putative ATP-dependent helicase IRC20 [Podospora conica]|nr:putative ATP-dependent helicase IRC20 [Schizothecium conicum]
MPTRRRGRGPPPPSEDDFKALLIMIRGLPRKPDDEVALPLAENAAKRTKTIQDFRPICIARERVPLPTQEVDDAAFAATTHQNAGKMVEFSLSKFQRTYDWEIKLAWPAPRSRSAPPGSGSSFSFVADKDAYTKGQICALDALSRQSLGEQDSGAIWASVDINVEQSGAVVQLVLGINVYWNERLGFHVHTTANHPQHSLWKSAQAAWYPELMPSPPIGPQDFYEAAFVPDKDIYDAQVAELQVPQLEATLYPFQRRAVQWLLQREGAQWVHGRSDEVPCLHPYTAPTPDVPLTFEEARDADGATFYMSRVLGVATRNISHFRSIQCSQDIRGGILAEEMGLGKTVEVISLMLLHTRPPGPLKVFDSYLGKELLATSATLIVVPSALLDQWISELNRHAPGLSVMYYPGLKKASKNAHTKVTPALLNEYDVVITTYAVLRGEMWLALASDEPTRPTRKSREHERPTSPLVGLSWWRLCIDEAQTVENWTNNAAKLARLIPRINSWAITGTPVRDAIQRDIRGLLNFLRYEPYASDKKLWDSLTTRSVTSFRSLITSISMRHTKALVRSEISIPPQHRYVITMPFTAVEEQHYQSLFQELAASCGLDTQGMPIGDDWDPESPAVQSAMRVALDRLRQTALHPDIGNRNRRQRGNGMRTVAQVLDAMMEQSQGALRTDQRSLLQLGISHGLALAALERTKEALVLWEEVLEKSAAVVDECRQDLRREIEAAAKSRPTPDTHASHSDGGDEPDDDTSLPVKEARRRLRSALEIQHKAAFFCANGYFSIKSDEKATEPDSEEFRRLEKLEVEGYDLAKAIRKEILQETYGKAKSLMEKLATKAQNQSFAVIPESEPITEQGIECRPIITAFKEVAGALDLQANQVDDWREHTIQLLLRPLVDEETEEVTGEEFEESTKLQDDILIYTMVLRCAVADREAAVTGHPNFLVEYETKAATELAKAGGGPAPAELLALFAVREELKPECVVEDPYTSLRGLLSELRSLLLKLRSDAANGKERAQIELAIAAGLQKSIQSLQSEQMKAIKAMERETEEFTRTLNARLEYYRQLQAVSDKVAGCEERNLAVILDQEEALRRKIATSESQHRYLIHLKGAESNPEQSMCVICQSPFSIGVLTVCGHLFCKECLTLWFQAHRNCPMCKSKLDRTDLHDITLKPQVLKVHTEVGQGGRESLNQQGSPSKVSTIYSECNPEQLAEIKNIELDGPNFTTKVDTLVRHLLWLRESDPGAKSVVFSQYREFLDVLRIAFDRYRIGYSLCDKPNGIATFVEDAGTEVFLMHARSHANGLNLVNASHVFLCEPLLNTALELQAIARVDRIGQRHETTVWLYLVDGTVEESIYNLSVQRRMEHMGRASKGKSKESTPELLDVNLDVANARAVQEAQLIKLMGKGQEGISGEVVDKKDLWTCLFGQTRPPAQGGGSGLPLHPATRRFLGAEAAEERRMAGAGEA